MWVNSLENHLYSWEHHYICWWYRREEKYPQHWITWPSIVQLAYVWAAQGIHSSDSPVGPQVAFGILWCQTIGRKNIEIYQYQVSLQMKVHTNLLIHYNLMFSTALLNSDTTKLSFSGLPERDTWWSFHYTGQQQKIELLFLI